jgi:seryl-tRNA synthetase
MLDIRLIKKDPNFFIERLNVKGYDFSSTIPEMLKIYDEYIAELTRVEKLTAERKKVQEEITRLQIRKRKILESNQLPNDNPEFSKIYLGLQNLEGQYTRLSDDIEGPYRVPPYRLKPEELKKKYEEILLTIPNLPSEKVPKGKTPEDNEIVRTGGSKPELYKGAVPHWDLAKKYDLIDFELGNKITGSGFPVYKNKGAKIQRALIQYFLEYNTKAGYTEYMPPLMVNAATAYGTGQLPDKEGQMYHVTVDEFYLIPTAEVPVTNIYRDVILKEADLPIKMTAYTPCFRREAGSYGKDVRGLNRLHQFDKVEVVQLVHPNNSYDVLEEMVTHVEKLVQSLELPYRILKLCGGDMSFTSALTYDFEVYSAAQDKWLEVSSVSNFESFQTNRMKIRFKDEKGKTQLAHSLNGSSLALPRILACLLENNQTENGIQLPVVLHGYFGSEMI